MYFKNLKDPNSASFIRYQSILHDAAGLFLGFQNFINFKREDLIPCGELILQNGWLIWSLFLFFNFKNFKDPNFASLTRFKCILHDSAVLFTVVQDFLKFKRGDLISWGTTNSTEQLPAELFGLSCLHFNFKNLKQLNSRSFIIFQPVLHKSFLRFSEFPQIKKGAAPNFLGGTNSAEQLNYLDPISVYISILRIWVIQILRNSLDFNAFCMMQQSLSQFFNISSNLRRTIEFLGGNQFWGTAELFRSPFCISISKISRRQVLAHSLHFSSFGMIQQSFSQLFKISQI